MPNCPIAIRSKLSYTGVEVMAMAEQPYKEMYLVMARAAEKAVRILIEAQQRCEELYIAEESGGDAEEPSQ